MMGSFLPVVTTEAEQREYKIGPLIRVGINEESNATYKYVTGPSEMPQPAVEFEPPTFYDFSALVSSVVDGTEVPADLEQCVKAHPPRVEVGQKKSYVYQYEKALLGGIAGEMPVLVNPSRGTLWTGSEVGIKRCYFTIEGEWVDEHRKLARARGYEEVDSVEGSVVYLGSNGTKNRDLPASKYYALLPVPTKLPVMFEGASATMDGEVLIMKYMKKGRLVEIEQQLQEYMYTATQTAQKLRVEGANYTLITSEPLQLDRKDRDTMYPFMTSFLTDLPPYRELVGDDIYEASYDDHYLYDIVLDGTYYSRRGRIDASRFGLEWAPLEGSGPVAVDWDTDRLHSYDYSGGIIIVNNSKTVIHSVREQTNLPEVMTAELFLFKPKIRIPQMRQYHSLENAFVMTVPVCQDGDKFIAKVPTLDAKRRVLFAAKDIDGYVLWLLRLCTKFKSYERRVLSSDRLTPSLLLAVGEGKTIGEVAKELNRHSSLLERDVYYDPQLYIPLTAQIHRSSNFYFKARRDRTQRFVEPFAAVEGIELQANDQVRMWHHIKKNRYTRILCASYVKINVQVMYRALCRNNVLVLNTGWMRDGKYSIVVLNEMMVGSAFTVLDLTLPSENG